MDRDGTFQRKLQEGFVLSPRNNFPAGYVLFPVEELIRVPPGIEGALACPILCAGVTSYVAGRKMQPQQVKWCTISGVVGGVGHIAIQYASGLFGLKVLAIDGGFKEKKKTKFAEN